jgi:hypothetical protein
MADVAALAGPAAGVSFAAGVAGAMAMADSPYPRPGADPATVRRYFTGSAGAARVSVGGQLLSAASLAGFTISVARLADRSGSRGLRAAALAGGAVATAALTSSAALSAALTGPRGRADASAAALHKAAFVAGGPVHTAGFGLLLGALGLAGLRTGAISKPLAYAALGSAGAGLLSPLALVTPPAAWLIPAGRFPGLLVSGIAGAQLGRAG